MKTGLTLNQKKEVDGVTYEVIGIDSYTLTNIYEQKREWLSYTLVDVANKENRIWLGYGFADNFLIKQWLISEEEFKKNTQKRPLNTDLTGIAHITFEGEQGYSIQNSEIIWYNSASDQYDFFVIERFLKEDGDKLNPLKSYYHGMKILKDLKV